MKDYKTPPDNISMTEKFRKDKGGICGQACLAVIEDSSIVDVMNTWKELGLEFKGWSGWRQLREYLEKRGYSVKQKNKVETYISDRLYLARVQWIGEGKKKDKPFYGWGHWAEASSYTHFIIIVGDKAFFCNEVGGWQSIFRLRGYLRDNNGLITSYLEIEEKKNEVKPNSSQA